MAIAVAPCGPSSWPWEKASRYYTLGQARNLVGIEMIDLDRGSGTAELSDELSRLLDRLGAVVIRPSAARHAAAPGADHRRAGLTERGGDAAPGAPGRPRD
ncbi:hypothetical protein BJ970_001453 [Saccharopolyspora phatthalungensis]|uniref:Uncharacterized protein n=1 Tax=Saccharopolyspora phatthalungensis TaxID=664693 RepID=A0A840Q5F2_9PSEU|nr:hypothetical protein [Saccharopolyspora phatthalungensis]